MSDIELTLERLRRDYSSAKASLELARAVIDKVAALCQGDPRINTQDKLIAIRDTLGVDSRCPPHDLVLKKNGDIICNDCGYVYSGFPAPGMTLLINEAQRDSLHRLLNEDDERCGGER